MRDLSWTQPGYFDSQEDEPVLHHCIARYHAFVFPFDNQHYRASMLILLSVGQIPGFDVLLGDIVLRADLGY